MTYRGVRTAGWVPVRHNSPWASRIGNVQVKCHYIASTDGGRSAARSRRRRKKLGCASRYLKTRSHTCVVRWSRSKCPSSFTRVTFCMLGGMGVRFLFMWMMPPRDCLIFVTRSRLLARHGFPEKPSSSEWTFIDGEKRERSRTITSGDLSRLSATASYRSTLRAQLPKRRWPCSVTKPHSGPRRGPGC